ncbi:MAG TPA: hypothetical protein VF473_07825 [Cyclobacteriaceae bacterium]
MNPLDSLSSSGSGLVINGESVGYLKESGGWARFLAIVGFVCVGFIVIIAFFVGAVFSSLGMGGQLAGMEFMVGLFYIGMAALWFFPTLFLFRFATNVLEAVQTNDTPALVAALKNLKSWFKFTGILTAIGVGFFVLFFIFGLLAGSMM